MAAPAATTRFLEGVSAIQRGDREAGVAALRAARLADHHPWRVTEPMAAVIRREAEACGATFVAPEDAFLADARYLAPADPLFEDQVHPTFDGVRVLAMAVVAGLAPMLPAGATWSDPGDIVSAPRTDAARGYQVPGR